MRFEPPDPDEVDDYLQSEPCLLLANPLSVKGEVLGVMVVEEPDPLPVEGFDGGRSNRRMREKRLEITTGISQQAALAIQNDRLQREMVERERLEREMQLAREIQVTFLPHRAPEIEGWEVNVRWRTAREVGGDFYDFFELPNNRLGLVIADVADKGMPAALFMTLIRTLVRASVQENSSPAEVLAHVNDVLVPDAQGGMFVTLVYAVLSIDTGELTYGNAGHNPPLLLRSRSGKIERLERGGMALGVLESSRVEARTVRLEPGDILILYTDGITETFSPGGEMYGEARLRQVAQSAAQPPAGSASALGVLEAIDQSVEEFLGQSSPADDLTMVVIRRLPQD
jgi:serine phosphatase RsbU (regulator of sigma subunit)